jgi:hypothetical protein
MVRKGEIGLLFLAFFLLYSISSPGNMIGDSEVRWRVAESLVDTGWFDIPPEAARLPAVGADGKLYCFYGPGQSLLLVPFVLIGKALAAMPLPVKTSSSVLGQMTASLVLLPLCGAAAVVLLYRVVQEATGDRRSARWAAVLYGAGTMHWHHTVNTYEESQIAVCLLAGLWAVQRFWRRDRWGYLALAFACLGAAVCFRVSAVVVFFPLLLIGFGRDLIAHPPARERLRRLVRWVLAGIAGAGPFLLAVGVYNATRFGSPLETGYGAALSRLREPIGLFQTPLLEGLGGMILSPGKSVFLFNPVLVLAAVGLVGLWRTHRALAGVVAGTFAATVLFHAKFTFWAGDLAWGPRYLAGILGVCMVGIVPVLRWKSFRWVLPAVAILSVCVQVASVMYSFGLEFFQDRRHGTIPDAYVWRPAESQLLCRFRNIALHAVGRPDYESVPPERPNPVLHQTALARQDVMRMHTVGFFPFKAEAATRNARAFHWLLGIWLAEIVALGFTILLWRRRVGGFPPPCETS